MNTLHEWRVVSGLSQRAAAELVGVSSVTWSDWERGRKQPRIRLALKIAEITDGVVPVTYWENSISSS